MKIRHVVLLLSVIVLCIGSSQAQPGPREIATDMKKEQSPAAPKSPAPTIEKPSTPPEARPDYQAQANEINSGIRDYTAMLVVVTLLLGVIAALQFWQTFWGQRKVERAYGFGGPGPERKQRDEGLHIRLEFGNYGRTPAFLKEVEWDVIPEGAIPPIPHYSNRLLNHLVALPGTRENTEAAYMCRADWKEPHVLSANFHYEDIYGRRHHSSLLCRIKLSRSREGAFVAAHPPLSGHAEYFKWN